MAAVPRCRRVSDYKPRKLGAPLSNTELLLLPHVAEGRSDKEIARLAAISSRTVEAHVRHMLQKSGAQNRTALAVWACRTGKI